MGIIAKFKLGKNNQHNRRWVDREWLIFKIICLVTYFTLFILSAKAETHTANISQMANTLPFKMVIRPDSIQQKNYLERNGYYCENENGRFFCIRRDVLDQAEYGYRLRLRQ